MGAGDLVSYEVESRQWKQTPVALPDTSAPSLALCERFLLMRVVSIDVFIEPDALRAASQEMLKRSTLFSLAACLTKDVLMMRVANRCLEKALAYSLSVERMLGPPGDKSYE